MTKVLMEGIAFGESPRWHDDRLWFADWGAREIISVGLDGFARVELRVDFPAFPMCFDWLPSGELVVVASRDRRLLRVDGTGALSEYADLGGLPAKGWNEIVIDGRGNAYVNGANFDPMAGEAPQPGIIALLASDGTARQVADGLLFPNGMAVTPDNRTLIAADSYGRCLRGYDIATDGTLSGARIWADLGDGVPDGICLDEDGAAWYADVPNKRCVRVREGGETLDTITLDHGAFACMLGGPDRRTLFIVGQEWRGMENADDGSRTGRVVSAQAPAPGAGWP